MKTILTIILSLSFLSNIVMAWEIEKPIDHAKQLNSADLIAIVEVLTVEPTGITRKIKKDNISYRELRVTFKVLSTLKGDNPKEFSCIIYREPTIKEKEADGMTTKQIMLTEVGVQDRNLARVKSSQDLLVYLSSKGDIFSPLAGDLYSGRSFLFINPSY